MAGRGGTGVGALRGMYLARERPLTRKYTCASLIRTPGGPSQDRGGAGRSGIGDVLAKKGQRGRVVREGLLVRGVGARRVRTDRRPWKPQTVDEIIKMAAS